MSFSFLTPATKYAQHGNCLASKSYFAEIRPKSMLLAHVHFEQVEIFVCRLSLASYESPHSGYTGPSLILSIAAFPASDNQFWSENHPSC